MDNINNFTLLRAAYDTMTRTEKRIADYIAANYKSAMNETVTELAAHTQSSEITISRFCKKLGFPGLQGLKIALASEATPAAPRALFENISASDDAETVTRRVFQNLVEGLQDTLKILNFNALDHAADKISQARQVIILGLGNSATVARDIETRFLRFAIPVRAYDDPHLASTAATLLTPDDVVIAVSHTGRSLDILSAIEAAHAAGATIIALTSYAYSPVARAADIVLSGMGREVRYCSEAIASRLIHMAITDALYVRIAMRMPERYQDNMQRMRAVIAPKKKER